MVWGGRHPSEWGGGWGPQLLRMKKKPSAQISVQYNDLQVEISEYAATTYTKYLTTNDYE
jgi:hypothetical protein